jgi:hypothetical protein
MELSDLHLLQTVPAYHVQAIVKNRQLAPFSGGQKSEAEIAAPDLEEVAESLFEQRACRTLLHTLDGPEARVLRELVACGGRANSRDLALYLSLADSSFASHPPAYEDGLVTYSPSTSLLRHAQSGSTLYPPPHPHGPFEQALHHLLLLGLLFWGKQTNFVGRDYASGVYDGVLIVPQTIVKLARQEWRFDEEPASLPPEQPGEGVYTLQRALYLYWSLVAGARDGLPLVSSRLLSRTALRQVLDNLASLSTFWQDRAPEQLHSESDLPFLLFLRLLLMQLGLLVERQGALRAVQAQAQAFFSLPLAERAWRCLHLWLETSFWNELAFIPNVVAQPGPAPLEPAHEEVVRSRQVVVQHVLRSAPGNWHALPAFIARMKLHATYLLFPRQYGLRAERYSIGSNPYGWNFRLRRGWLTHREGWHMVEGGFIRSVITGPLTWLGIVELDPAEHPDAFRLAQGARLVAGAEPPTSEDIAWGRLVVQPNFDLIALAPVSEALLVSLDRFAERVRLEHIAQYHLSKASVTRAIQLGLTAEEMQKILEQAAGGEIPQPVHYSLAEWERQARRIEIWRNTALLEVDDPAVLDQLCADQEARVWILRRLAPTLAEVSREHLTELQELLWQREYLPAVSSAAHYQNLLTDIALPTHEPQWRLTAAGLLEPCYPRAHLYLATELEQFTERDETTGWRRITAASLQGALNSGLTLDGILRFLQHYCAGGIPGSLLIRLKLWGSGYPDHPDLQVEAAPLLSLAPQVLNDLLADEEIGPLLATPVPAEKRLVRVPQENLARVIELLKERGFEVL